MKFTRVPKELRFAVDQAVGRLGLKHNAKLRNKTVCFVKGKEMSLTAHGNTITIGYSKITDATRALSFLPRMNGRVTSVTQKAKFDLLSTMVDCSRNAVLNVNAAKDFITDLAIIGFNSIMFYTEDTYEIPEYPYFGHLRGKYTVEEMKELNEFGNKMGVEVIPCIQTLAHLNAITDWKCFSPYIDVKDILLVDDERTYQLIEAMLKTLRECFDSKHINIGMDEAHLLGRGKHTDRYGYEPKADIMVRHLSKVVELCKKYDFEPVMWSDMFFRMQFDGNYRVAKGELQKEVIEKIPEDVAMCYWEYYTNPNDLPRLKHMFHCHQTMNRELWFAGGAWSWSGMVPKNRFSMWVTPKQLDYAVKSGVKNIIATCWGDDGAECPIFGMLPALLQYAEYCYDNTRVSTLNRRCKECFGLSLDDFLKVDTVGNYGEPEKTATHPVTYEKAALYNDPLLGLMNFDLKAADLSERYAQNVLTLEEVPLNRYYPIFENQLNLARLLEKKYSFNQKLRTLYNEVLEERADPKSIGEKERELEKFAINEIDEITRLLDVFIQSFRAQWHWVNKPFGFEIQDLRLGGLKQRLETTAWRIDEFLNGTIDRIEELEQPELPWSCDENKLTSHLNNWRHIATRSVTSH